MSKELQELGKPKPTQEQLRADLLDYLKDAKVGTPKHIALNDSITQVAYQSEYGDLHSELDRLLQENDPYRLKIWESRMRENELHRVFLYRDIRNNESTIPGYRQANGHIQAAFNQLDTETTFEIAHGVLYAPENNT